MLVLLLKSTVKTGWLLTILNYNYKPSTKHGKEHITKYLHRIGVILIEFHSFGESLFLQGVYQEKRRRNEGRWAKRHILL